MTGEKKAAFVRAYRRWPNVGLACLAAGVTRADVLAARDDDPRFEKAWRGAEALARDEVLAYLAELGTPGD